MAINVLGAYDVTADARSQTTESASLSDVFGLLVREKTYRLSDPVARYNPFANGAIFNANQWRNGAITETDDFANVISVASINNVGFNYTDAGKETLVTARDTFGVLKDWVIEELLLKSENTISTRYGNAVNRAAQFSGLVTLTNTGGPLNIAVGDVVSFNPDIIPRYQVTAVTVGTPTPSIQLDRPLEFAVTASAILRVMSPVVKTGPKALKDALIAAGLNSLGTTFDALNVSDTTAGLNIRLFVRKENKIKMTDHLMKIMSMCDLFLTVDENNVINCFRGLQYDGGVIVDTVTGDEIMLDIEMKFDTQKLYFAYDCLYDNAGKVTIASGVVSGTLLAQYAARERWQPISAASEKPIDYEYLYASETAASFFGQRRITYNGYPRGQMTFSMKQNYSGFPNRLYNLVLGKKLLISLDLGGGRALDREPVTVIAYTYDNQNQYYSSVTVELTNWLFPELAVPT